MAIAHLAKAYYFDHYNPGVDTQLRKAYYFQRKRTHTKRKKLGKSR